MIHAISSWLLVAGFFAAGLLNAIGTSTTRGDFARWGYPRWWGRFTGALELVGAALIALPATYLAGLALAAAIIAAAVLTVVRHREFAHLVPLGVFAVVIALAAITA